jgi:apolipoprotein N-acyltransferase
VKNQFASAIPVARRRPLRAVIALVLAAVGGWMLSLASPSAGWWPLAFAGAWAILIALWERPLLQGAGLGALAGATFWLPHLHWLTLYLGPIPWLALSAVMIVWMALMGALISFTTRSLGSWQPLQNRPAVLILAQSLTVTGVWIAREQAQSSWPYGGFSWGRLALTQADSMFAEAVSWIGIAGLSAVMVLVPALITSGFRRSTRKIVWPVATGVLLLAGTAVLPAAVSEGNRGDVTVAGVQGNAKAGIFDDRESGDVIQSHLDATERMNKDRSATHSSKKPDVIVWPENSAEFDIRENHANHAAVTKLAHEADAPILVGSILEDTATAADGAESEQYFNSSLVVEPDGTITGRYDKRYPVPFAEYMPHRAFFRALVPDLVDLVQLDYQPGSTSSVLDMNGVKSGIAICFDITFDRHVTDMVESGAEIVYAQTNNADFGYTAESAQQLAITRLEAISMGRSLVNVSTVGTSEIIGPDGQTIDAIASHKPGYVEATVPKSNELTPAMKYGSSIVAGLLGFAGAGTAISCLCAYAVRRGDRLRAR